MNPDAIIYDEKLHLVYAADHDGKAGTLIDAQSERLVATIDLGGEPEFCQADPGSGLIYQNLEDTSEVVVIDPHARAVIRRYKLAPGEGPTGLALDPVNRRLFSATGNKKLLVLSSDTGEVVADLPIGLLVDGVAYDSGLKRIYTANEMGTRTVIQQDSADRYRVLENAPTHLGGHSVVVDPSTHLRGLFWTRRCLRTYPALEAPAPTPPAISCDLNPCTGWLNNSFAASRNRTVCGNCACSSNAASSAHSE